jgi:hypothetical protein
MFSSSGIEASMPRSRTSFVGAMALALVLAAAPGAAAQQQQGGAPASGPTDIGWPRQVQDGSNTITVYQPQVESWQGNQLQERAAVSVSTPASPTPTFGVIWFTARTEVDKQSRIVTLDDIEITRASFPTKPDQQDAYRQALQAAIPQGARTIALDRLEANLEVTQATQGSAKGVQVKNAPPRIIVSDKPAILVLVDGEPALRQLDGSPSLLRVINTRALLVIDQSSGTYYLYTMNRWASAGSLDGPWAFATSVPDGLDAAKSAATQGGQVDLLSDPPGEAKTELEQGVLPVLYVSTVPAELLQTSGAPQYQPIAGTQLLDVTNTTSDIFMDTANQTYYVLISGRWFSAPSLTDGPWTFVPSDQLPSDFASIPFQHPKGTVLTSVSSTPQAKEASISANVPQTATVKRSEAKMPPPQYDGEPKFAPIEGTSLKYAVNTATPVIETAPGQYYAVVNGVWFAGSTPSGPWIVTDSVPAAIYTIPPSSPLYYVTYVHVYGGTPDVVYVGYTPGYYGTYVVPAGTVVYGTGYVYQPWVGSVWIGPPYTYGFGAGFAFGSATGFALGLAAGAFCHPWWGPAGWGWGWGWGGGSVNINRTVNVNNVNVYNRWGHNTVIDSGNRYAGHVGNTTFAGHGGDVYADRNGNVYRRQDGSWQKYDNGQWNDVPHGRDEGNMGTGRGAAEGPDRGNAGNMGVGRGPGEGPNRGDVGDMGAARGDGLAGGRDGFGGLDRDWQARQAGDQRWNAFRQGGGDRFARAGFGGGDRFGGGFRGGFGGGGFRGGGGRR